MSNRYAADWGAPRRRDRSPPILRALFGSFFLAGLLSAAIAGRGVAMADTPSRGELTDGGIARAVEVVDGDTLVLSDGSEVRLVGIQAPKLALGREGFQEWPLAPEAKEELSRLALGNELEIAFGDSRYDRHGRVLAHLFRADGLWLQGAMVEAGLARVYGFHDNRALLDELYALERIARANRRGIWAEPYYAVLSAARLEQRLAELVDSFQIVEGRVQSTAVVRGRGYINFGSDWRRDVTGSLSGQALDLFEAAGISLVDYEGRLVRLRGWVEDYNGPMISVTHPEQIEVLE